MNKLIQIHDYEKTKLISNLSDQKQTELLSLLTNKITVFLRTLDFNNSDHLVMVKKLNNIIHRISGRMNDLVRGEKWSSVDELLESIRSDINRDLELKGEVDNMFTQSITDVMNGIGA